ncbi:Uncharacterised protein [Mycobacteroides abscessus]|nr:Uncharacterised protein [Mycobacteroides abscessus]
MVGRLLVSYRAAAGFGGDFDQIVTDPEPQQLSVDMDIATRSGPVPAHRDLCQDAHTTPLVVTVRDTQS